MIPIGERAVAWLEKYLREARPQLVVEPDDGTVFLTAQGEPFSRDQLTRAGARARRAGESRQERRVPLFRHTMATLMLEDGADIRFIQEMLGHAELEDHANLHAGVHPALKQIHSATHPGATLEKKKPASTCAVTHDEASLRANLLATLDAEAEEESESNERGARR